MKKYNLFTISIALLMVGFQSCRHHPIEPVDDNTDTISSGECDPDSIYFNQDVMPIIQQNCAVTGCHGGGSAQNGVDLTSYQSIMNTADVEPFDTDGSDLYEVITETDPDDIMPQPPNPPLTNEEIDIIAAWINQGAQNNFCADCDEDVFTFSGAVEPIIQNNCVGCHSGSNPSGGISLTTYNEIYSHVSSGQLYGAINHESGYVPMPYNLPKLSDCKVNQVKQWIDNGAQDD